MSPMTPPFFCKCKKTLSSSTGVISQERSPILIFAHETTDQREYGTGLSGNGRRSPLSVINIQLALRKSLPATLPILTIWCMVKRGTFLLILPNGSCHWEGCTVVTQFLFFI